MILIFIKVKLVKVRGLVRFYIYIEIRVDVDYWVVGGKGEEKLGMILEILGLSKWNNEVFIFWRRRCGLVVLRLLSRVED